MGKAKLLIVDDEELALMNLSDYFEDEGFDVFPATSGEAAMRLMGTHNFLVAIVDMRLSGMDGNSFILLAQKIQPDMAFIVHTGSPEYHVPEELRELGISPEYIFQKPIIDFKKLNLLIHKHLNQD